MVCSCPLILTMPQADIGKSVQTANDMQDEIEFVMGNAEEYVQRAMAGLDKNAPCEQYDMELIGSKYQHILMGALSSRSYLKREILVFSPTAGENQTVGIWLPRNEQYPDAVFSHVLFKDDFRAFQIKKYQVTVMEQKDGLINLLDKRSGFRVYRLNLLVEEADAGDAWDYSPPWIKGETVLSTQGTFVSRLVEAGPVCARLEIRGEISVPERLIGDERSPERPKEIEPWYQPPTQLLPCREWIAIQDKKYRLAVALKGMYDYEAVANGPDGKPDLYVTLLRGFELMGRINLAQRKRSASMVLHTPGAQCIGTQVMEWSYNPLRTRERKCRQYCLAISC